MIPFKERSSIEQCIPGKSKRWGFKVSVRAGATGYIYSFKVYQGGTAGRWKPSTVYGMAGVVVLRLTRGLKEKSREVYADNLLRSVLLVNKFEDDIFYVGTWRQNRLQGAHAKEESLKQMKNEGRASTSLCCSSDNVTVTRWFENALVHIVSS